MLVLKTRLAGFSQYFENNYVFNIFGHISLAPLPPPRAATSDRQSGGCGIFAKYCSDIVFCCLSKQTILKNEIHVCKTSIIHISK